MPVATKLIRSRIKSVKNTRKITKAMELVAASKMRKATEAAITSRPYNDAARAILAGVAQKKQSTLHPLLRVPERTKRELVIVITSNRGLCGGLNANVIRESFAYIRARQAEGCVVKAVTVGKKGRAQLAKAGVELVADFPDITSAIDFLTIRPLGQLALQEFNEQRVDRVTLIYTHFQSALIQRSAIQHILPMTHLFSTDGMPPRQPAPKAHPPLAEEETEYLFEPSAALVYQEMLPRFLETQVYHAILEAVASEHSARMLAMRNASDAADDITQDLTLTYNQARQAAITQEIAEIAGGAAALA